MRNTTPAEHLKTHTLPIRFIPHGRDAKAKAMYKLMSRWLRRDKRQLETDPKHALLNRILYGEQSWKRR